MMMIILVASLTPVAQCKFRFLSLFFSLNSLQIRSATTVRVGAGAGAHAACEQIGCWAGVEVNFKSLLYVAQHANEKKNRDSICMLGWSCSNKTSIAACHVLDPIDHVLDHADGRRCARSSLCADPSVCQRSRRLSQRLLFRFRRALSAVSGGAVRCVLQPAACCLCLVRWRGSSAPTAAAGQRARFAHQAQALRSRRRMRMQCGRAALRGI